jgi:peptide/nickel transport system ATP-binding protein
MAEKLLQVKHLEVNFATRQGVISPVRGVSFEVHAHETLGIIGESGCGKSVTAQALMGLLSPRTTRVEGEVVLAGEALHSLSARVRRQRSGRDMAMIFQDPLASLNPVMTIGEQIAESLRLHTTLSRRQRQEKSSACSNRWAYPILPAALLPGPMNFPAVCASG